MFPDIVLTHFFTSCHRNSRDFMEIKVSLVAIDG